LSEVDAVRVLKGFRIALASLTANLTRALLATVGIMVGVAVVIGMLAVGEGARREAVGKIHGMGTNLLIITAGQIRTAGRSQAGTVTTLTVKDVDAVVDGAPAVARAVPIQSQKLLVKAGAGATTTTIVGTSDTFPAVRQFRVGAGRFFDAEEVHNAQRVAVVGQTVLTKVSAGRELIGETIRINNVSFEVIGILERKGINYAGVDEDDQILIPVSTALRRLFNQTHLSNLYVQARDEGDMARAMEQVAAILRERHRIRPGQPDDFTIQAQTDLLAAAEETSQTFSLLLVGVAGISLLVGGIGILAMMVISVRERTREIGVRRAVGARRRDIMLQFLLEATALSVIGGVMGTVVGLAGAAVVSLLTGWPTAVAPLGIVLAVGISAAIGIVFGTYPARRAAHLNPVVALRAE
jgi:putative ABC transport system permease protein